MERKRGQGVLNFKRFDVFAAVELSNTKFWRDGKVKNGQMFEERGNTVLW